METKTLEIVMPHWTEDWEVVRPYFDMLKNQKGIDFRQIRVHVVHDGTKAFTKEQIGGMPFELRQSQIKHGGVSAARNYGLKNANAKWISFCDCDDMYSSVFSLRMLMDTLWTEDYDMLWGKFFMEDMPYGRWTVSTQEKFNMVWTHNKYYRLDFLKKHGIMFDESLYMSEDSAFNAVVSMEIGPDRIGEIKSQIPLYVWCWRKESVTAKYENLLRNIEGHHNRNVYVMNEYKKRNNPSADGMVVRTMTDDYVQLTRKSLPEGKEKVEEIARQFFREHRETFFKMAPEEISKILHASEREAHGARCLNPERPKFLDWLKYIDKAG